MDTRQMGPWIWHSQNQHNKKTSSLKMLAKYNREPTSYNICSKRMGMMSSISPCLSNNKSPFMHIPMLLKKIHLSEWETWKPSNQSDSQFMRAETWSWSRTFISKNTSSWMGKRIRSTWSSSKLPARTSWFLWVSSYSSKKQTSKRTCSRRRSWSTQSGPAT